MASAPRLGVDASDAEGYPLLRPDRLPYLPAAFLLQAQADVSALISSSGPQVRRGARRKTRDATGTHFPLRPIRSARRATQTLSSAMPAISMRWSGLYDCQS